LAQLIMRIAGKPNLKIHHDVTEPQGVRGRNADLTLVKKILDWQPTTTLEYGIEELYYWVKQQLERIWVSGPVEVW